MQIWTYHSDAGRYEKPDGSFLGICYSGHGAGLNNPAMESIHKIGPIPAGYYRFGTFFDDLEPNPPDGLDHKGAHVCHLISVEPDGSGGWKEIPPPYGRLGLMQHGDNGLMNHTASEGCMIAARFIRDLNPAGDILHVVFST